jgi:hypothetical protein
MARVRELFRENGSARPHPTEVECGWQIVNLPDGKRLLQLSTYGSDLRQSEKKVSQTLQFDQARAAELVDVVKKTFGV